MALSTTDAAKDVLRLLVYWILLHLSYSPPWQARLFEKKTDSNAVACDNAVSLYPDFIYLVAVRSNAVGNTVFKCINIIPE